MQQFVVGQQVECIEFKDALFCGMGGVQWEDSVTYYPGKIAIVYEITADGLLSFGSQRCRYNPACFRAITKENNMGTTRENPTREFTIEERIENLQDGWNQEADALLNELRDNRGFIVWQGGLRHFIVITSASPMGLDCNGNVSGANLLTKFDFSVEDSCAKHAAFKAALRFLARNRKLAPGTEIKAEINNKTYQVKIIKQL